MTAYRIILLACTAGVALAASPAQASIDEYTVEGSQALRINLEVCSAESQLAVRGDSGTDLDFLVTDASGQQVHSDQAVDDYLSIVIEKDGDACETFALAVDNLGEEANTFTVVLEPVTAASTRIEKYVIQASETRTIPLKACGSSAGIVARGDGDTDLDFVIRNSDEGVVHENDDTTDETVATLAGLRSDCEIFDLEVANLGNVYNALMVVITPEGVNEAPFAGTAPSTSLASVTDGGGAPQTSRPTTDADESGAGQYRAEATSVIRVALPVCGATRLEVRGDGDTDLDFTVADSEGLTVHSDLDLSDVTFARLEPKDECETFSLSVDNLGEVYNDFTIALIDAAQPAGTSGAGAYQVSANAMTKVLLRVCDDTRVSVSGDGDTDLDFEVFGSGGATIHSDYDLTDSTEFTLESQGECADYALSVNNLGNVYNAFTVAFDGDTAGAVSGDAGEPATPRAKKGASAKAPDTLSTDAQNRSMILHNRSGEEIEMVYWSNGAVLGWGENKLGGDVALGDGAEWSVNVFDGSAACIFDFKGVTSSGREISVTGVNACEDGSVTFE